MGPLQPPYADNADKTYKRVCVYPNWSILRESAVSRILPEDIDPNLCTHIHYAFAKINPETLELINTEVFLPQVIIINTLIFILLFSNMI